MGSRILLLEDEALIAMMLRDWIAQLGHEVRGPCHDVAAAAAYLDGDDKIDAALLDVHLADGDSFGVADELSRRKLPFAFMTGQPRDQLGGRYADAPVLPKPCDFASVERTIATLLVREDRAL